MDASPSPSLSQQYAELNQASNDNPLGPTVNPAVQRSMDHPVPDYPCSVHEECNIHEECCLPLGHGNDCQSINFAISRLQNEIAYLRSDVYAKVRALDARLDEMDHFGVTNMQYDDPVVAHRLRDRSHITILSERVTHVMTENRSLKSEVDELHARLDSLEMQHDTHASHYQVRYGIVPDHPERVRLQVCANGRTKIIPMFRGEEEP